MLTCFTSFFSCVVTAGVEIFLLMAPNALRLDGRGVLKVLAIIGDFKSFSGGWGKKQNVIAHFHTESLLPEEKNQTSEHNIGDFPTWSRLKPLSHLQSRWMKTCIFSLCEDYVGHCIWKHNLILANATHYNCSRDTLRWQSSTWFEKCNIVIQALS